MKTMKLRRSGEIEEEMINIVCSGRVYFLGNSMIPRRVRLVYSSFLFTNQPLHSLRLKISKLVKQSTANYSLSDSRSACKTQKGTRRFLKSERG